ncbi:MULTISPECIES: hypothetical protein [unclassified Mycobacterium]|uniref:hypothetical protein n=1 Tax=unclassified Mycobacterium TaxID=2642494 RepID=UPI000800E90B|nr:MULTISPECIES: hypothetical protein [unclassified Mycobacterium]OBG76250.1 hypothetical protein A5700_22470 [Mycobacterium sp. E1214]OBH23789.1 hypothetical protein A5693_09600 [Mycobacterium sp. E1319]
MTQQGALDALKFLAAEGHGQLGAVLGRLRSVAVKQGSEAELETAIDLVRQFRGLAVELASRLCADAHDFNHYSDGRQIQTSVEIEPGCRLDYRWFPDPADPANQPRTLVERHVCANGRQVSVVVSAPGILDVVGADRPPMFIDAPAEGDADA